MKKFLSCDSHKWIGKRKIFFRGLFSHCINYCYPVKTTSKLSKEKKKKLGKHNQMYRISELGWRSETSRGHIHKHGSGSYAHKFH